MGRFPLTGVTVLVTRPAGQAEETAARLRALGAEVLLAPAIEVAPPASYADLDRAIGRIDAYRLVALVSANGVAALVDRLRAAGLDHRALDGKIVAAVGDKTAAVLAAQGIRVDHVARESTAEGLGRELEHFDLGTGPALLPRAADGREVLIEALRARGLTVDAPTAYRTVDVSPERLRWAVDRLPDIHGILFGSPRTVRAFLAALPEPSRLASLVVGAVGPTTATALDHAGVRVDVVARPHTFEALVEAMVAPLVAQRLARTPPP